MIVVFLLFLLIDTVCSLQNGVARRPPMGFNTWNAFGCSTDEDVVLQHMKLMVELGLREVGYEFFNLDDCWQYFFRDMEGNLVADPIRFSKGIGWLVQNAHSLGLKMGIYSDAGSRTCAGFPGSLGYEEQDAQLFAKWKVDYLKYDNCHAPLYHSELQIAERYAVMGKALNSTGRPMVYSLCEWGQGEPWRWGDQIANLWRVATDVGSQWELVMKSLDGMVGLGMYGGPGGWNDADILEVGNFVDLYYPFQVNRVQFALWAILKSPLLIGTDLRKITPQTLSVLKAKEVIQLNQDELGVPGDLIGKQGSQEIYACPLTNGSRGVVLLNRDVIAVRQQQSEISINITVNWEQLGWPAQLRATVRDLFLEEDIGIFSGFYTARVQPLDVVVLRISPLHQTHIDWNPWDHGFFGNKKLPYTKIESQIQYE
eukprot:TRINITY_DN4294_c0_g2_i2.p1 TRINITY_DN4294_c0_g2~~TRINITY_DN4294_c0_g2_i2.p1  ORF type:complete len:478 (-),score=35.65 TRINITY_DN4294_c0_g2_i2:396-1676(-)